MKEEIRNSLNPHEYIRRMFEETENGKYEVVYKHRESDLIEETAYFHFNWTEEDVEKVIQQFDELTFALKRIAEVHDQLDSEESRKELLSESDQKVWNTFVCPYEPMEVDWDRIGLQPLEHNELMSLIHTIHERGKYGDLFEEEEYLWDVYCKWLEVQSQKRIPFNRRSSSDLIPAAARYERALSLNAPESVVNRFALSLAEELVHYIYGDEEPVVWD